MSGGGKGGSSTTEIPGWVRQPAERNLARAENVQQIGYTPFYGADVAAFTAPQQQAFQNAGAAAQAFGLGAPSMAPTMPAQDFGGGVSGHSSGSLYDLAIAELKARNPGQYGAINQLFVDPITGERPAPLMPQQQNQGWNLPSSNHPRAAGNEPEAFNAGRGR